MRTCALVVDAPSGDGPALLRYVASALAQKLPLPI